MSQIQVSNIKSSYGRRQVLSDVSFVVEKGECAAVLGVNGCGKSTLLSILAGVRKPKSGSIIYEGRTMTEPYKAKEFSKFVGYVPQDTILIPELTVWDNLLLWYVDKKRLKRELEAGFMAKLKIGEMCSYKVNQLSGGMKKRVSIGCALASSPSILILDEPAAALDIKAKREIRQFLDWFRKEGGTVILTTHDEGELAACDRLYLLENGFCRKIQRYE